MDSGCIEVFDFHQLVFSFSIFIVVNSFPIEFIRLNKIEINDLSVFLVWCIRIRKWKRYTPRTFFLIRNFFGWYLKVDFQILQLWLWLCVWLTSSIMVIFELKRYVWPENSWNAHQIYEIFLFWLCIVWSVWKLRENCFFIFKIYEEKIFQFW